MNKPLTTADSPMAKLNNWKDFLSAPQLQLLRLTAEKARRSLKEFVMQAWPILEPDTEFVDGIHVHGICLHLQAVTEGRIPNLIINIPPGPKRAKKRQPAGTPAASETALVDIRSPRFLLFATHGYFMSDIAPVNALRMISQGGKTEWLPDFLYSMDPLMRSMLILSGANRRYKPIEREGPGTKGTPLFDVDDGLLTAFEVRGLDLLDTDVVLVGCESSGGIVPRQAWSGKGMHLGTSIGMQVDGGSLGNMAWTLPQTEDEGVSGLPQGFLAAGARSIISGAWTIPVRESGQLISDFMDTWLDREQGWNRYAAFHAAQLAALGRARQKADTHPFRWSGLTYIGLPDDAPNTAGSSGAIP